MTAAHLAAAQKYALENGLSPAVTLAPWPACEAMTALGAALDGDDRPQITVRGGRTRLRIGDPLVLSVEAPTFPSFMYVVYLQADGVVVNLLPRTNVMREQQPARWSRDFGDGSGGLPKFKVSPPTGNEAVLAIAARAPIAPLEALERPGRPYRLQLTPAPGTPENKAFLAVLRDGMASLKTAEDNLGPVVTASVLPLEIGD